jgi:hypothetical protein
MSDIESGLLSRAIGVILSPRATYARVVARPRALGALVLFLTIAVAGAFAFMSTEVGRQAALDLQIERMESFGREVPDEAYARMEAFSRYFPYFSAGYLLVFFPVATLALSGVLIGIFNAAMGGNGTFKQVYAVVTHSLMILAVQQLFVYPLDYAKQSLSNPATLAVFTPFLEETSLPARFLGSIDLFLVWWVVNLAIGIAVLYKKRTAPIATSLLSAYGALALVAAAVRTALSGA